jgi:hypothetical protein
MRIGSLQLIVHYDSAIRFQSGIQRQLDIWTGPHRDHHQIRRHNFTVRETHGFHAPIAKHGLNLGNRDITSALSQPAAGFRCQPTAHHHGARPF